MCEYLYTTLYTYGLRHFMLKLMGGLAAIKLGS